MRNLYSFNFFLLLLYDKMAIWVWKRDLQMGIFLYKVGSCPLKFGRIFQGQFREHEFLNLFGWSCHAFFFLQPDPNWHCRVVWCHLPSVLKGVCDTKPISQHSGPCERHIWLNPSDIEWKIILKIYYKKALQSYYKEFHMPVAE